MKFIELREKLISQFNQMQETGKLYRSTISGRDVWDTYLGSFKSENNPVFRDPNSSVHNGNLDKNFIRRYGNIVSLDSHGVLRSMFDIEIDKSSKYYDSVLSVRNLLSFNGIGEVFFETFNELNSLPYGSIKRGQETFRLGIKENHKIYSQEEADKFGVVTVGKAYKFNHFYVDLDKGFVDNSGKSVESLMADYRSSKEVFKRAMDEIPLDTLQLVVDLIQQGSLLNGQTHLSKVKEMLPLKEEYDTLESNYKDNWCWNKSYKLPFAKFKNELIGVLCSELAEGVELNKACQDWNKRVDPANYMKATAPITKAQIERAKEFVVENGYEDSFDRRFATIDDINVAEIIHVNSSGTKKTASVFDSVKPSKSTRHKRSQFDNIEEVTINKFMSDILPSCTSVEAFFENRFENNLVTLTTTNNKDSKPMFKWDNNYSWTYKGNLAGKSQIKEAVKSRGGKVDGDVRCSIHFPDTTDDYDLHLVQPDGDHIYFGEYLREQNTASGMLDLDAQGQDGHQTPDKRVENIVYSDRAMMPKGDYRIYVNNYSRRRFKVGFTVEIEIDGEVTLLKLDKVLHQNDVDVAIISFDGKTFSIKPAKEMTVIKSNTVSKEIWGLNTNEFRKVNLICLSPNHWAENNVGNKHYLFMLDGCQSTEAVRSFHNENLNGDLTQHRKVMEVLGATNMLEPSNKQLAGLGFNATVKDELIVKLTGSFKRTVKIKF